ncbi:unnamed protein product, partial [Ixodes pacificus]
MALGGCSVPGELCEGLVQFVRDSFVLLFLLDKLVSANGRKAAGRQERRTRARSHRLQVLQGRLHLFLEHVVLLALRKQVVCQTQSVHFLLELLHRPLGKFGSRFGLHGEKDPNSEFRSLHSSHLLLTDFQGLQVVANHSQLLLKLHNFAAEERAERRCSRQDRGACATCTPFSHLFVFLVGLLRDEPRLSQLVLEQRDPVVLHVGAVLQCLANALVAPDGGSPFALVSGLRGLFQFLGGDLESFLRAFQVLLKQLDAPLPSTGTEACTHSLQGLILLFQLVVGLEQLLLHLIQLILDGLNLLLQAADFLLGLRHVLYLLGAQGGIPGLLFRGLCSVHRIILLQLHRLHLLLDGLHLGCFRGGGGFGALDEVGPRTWDALGR